MPKKKKKRISPHPPGATHTNAVSIVQVPFHVLRPGSIHSKGWIRYYAGKIADGWTLANAKKQEPWLYAALWNRFRKQFPYPVEDQEAPDYCAYFSDGFIRLAHMLPESKLHGEFEPWMKKVVASQDTDGYLGALDPPGRWNNWLEVFHQCIIIEAMIYHFEQTGEKKFLKIAERAGQQSIKHWGKSGAMQQSLYGGHGACIIRPMLKLYSFRGKRRYLDFARKVLDRYGKTRHYLSGGDVGMQHNVCESEHIGLPALLYEFTGKRKYLKASLLAWERMQPYISVDGTPHGNEHTFRRRPRGNSEHCGSVEWSITNEHLLRITGEVRFADAAERAIFNGYPAAKSSDSTTVAYMHSPNQLLATEWSGPQFDDPDYCDSKQYFSSAHSPLCCNVISHRAMPYFVDHQVMAAGDGLTVALYGPCSVTTVIPNAGKVVLEQETDYPFEDVVRITITPERETKFPLFLRIPAWCSSASLDINGKALKAKTQPGSFARIRRIWRRGDRVTLTMKVPVRLELYPEGYVRSGGAAVIRGPLTFVLPVPEVWRMFPSVHNAPLSKVASYRVLPDSRAVWNYALMVDQDNPEGDFRLKTFDPGTGKNPWEHARIGLEVKARRVLNWKQEGNETHPMTPGLPFKPMKLAKRIETITLVPFGATRLRMAYLPLVDGVRAEPGLPATLITPVAPENQQE